MLQDILSIQLYSVRAVPARAALLAGLARLGYTNVEPFGDLYDDVDGLARDLGAAGLTAKSGHMDWSVIDRETARAKDIARRLGLTTLVVPYLPTDQQPTDRMGWQALGRRLAALSGEMADQGLRLAYHNHDFEFRPLPDGSLPIEHLLDAGTLWEADLAWIVRAGADPVSWLARYAGQVPLIHVKDIAPAGQCADEDGWADVGQGTLDWTSLWTAGIAAGAELMIAEHDNPADPERFARVSAVAMMRYHSGQP